MARRHPRAAVVLLVACAMVACHRQDDAAAKSPQVSEGRAWTARSATGHEPARTWKDFLRSGGRLPESPAERADLLASMPGGGKDLELALAAILNQGQRSDDERIFAANGLVLIGTESALQALFDAAIAVQEDALRKKILGALAMLSNADGIEALVSVAAQSTDQIILDAVEDTLARLASPESVDYLVELYGREPADSPHAASITRVLAGMKNPPVVEPLAAVLLNPDTPRPVFSAVATALGKIPAKQAALALVNGYHREMEPGRKAELLRGIGEIKEPAALEALNDVVAETGDSALREAAARALAGDASVESRRRENHE